MNGDQGQATTRVREAIDVEALSSWMVQQHELCRLISPATTHQTFRLSVRQFGFGQSNPTYKVTVVEASMKSKTELFHMVLRKKPVQVAHKSAHALDREFCVLSALQKHNNLVNDTENRKVPVPKVYSYCHDSSVLGSEFYLMEFVEGRIFTDPSLPGVSVTHRQAAFQNTLQVLASLHTVSLEKTGLVDYGKRSQSTGVAGTVRSAGYVERQLDSLLAVSRRQAELSGHPVPEAMVQIAAQLKAYAPHCPGQNLSPSLLHGDFKMDNLVFHPTEPRVIAVLDWELSTTGDALSDLANLSMMYFIPRNAPGIAGLVGLNKDLPSLGIPTRRELVCDYCRMRNERGFTGTVMIPSLDAVWDWSGFYLAFLFFKNCVIVQGVAQRAAAGTASSAEATTVAQLLPTIIHLAETILREHAPSVKQASRL